MMKTAGTLLLMATALSVSAPGAVAAQAASTTRAASTATSSARLPTLELVEEYRCTTCTQPGSFGINTTVAAGVGSAFAVLPARGEKLRVWDLSSGRTEEFNVTTRTDGRVQIPAGMVVFPDSVIVVGMTRLNRVAEKFGLDGGYVGSAPFSIAPSAGEFGRLDRYDASPSGTWGLQRQSSPEFQVTLVRTNRATGESETLDIPASVLDGYDTRLLQTIGIPAAISDDGTVVVGTGNAAYRFASIPNDASPRREGGRATARPTWTPKHVDQLAITIANNMFSRLPSSLDGRALQAGEADPGHVPDERLEPRVAQSHFNAVQFDARGRLWLSTNRGSFEAPQKTVFDVFSPTLEYLGEITVEGFVRSFDVGTELVAAAVLGIDGLTTVKVWRIREP
jgi:hypothetical protein